MPLPDSPDPLPQSLPTPSCPYCEVRPVRLAAMHLMCGYTVVVFCCADCGALLPAQIVNPPAAPRILTPGGTGMGPVRRG